MLSMLNAFSGGSFSKLSLFAFGVTPYITASIVLQLLGVTFPSLHELQKDGEYGRKKWEKINYCLGIGMSILQGISMTIVFGKQGILSTYTWWSVLLVTLIWAIGTACITGIGLFITKNGFGNGISLILMINIVSELPSTAIDIYNKFLKSQNISNIVFNSIVIIGICLIYVGATVVLSKAEKHINTIYPSNNKFVRTQDLFIPIKLNTANVMPIILTSTIYSLPIMFFSNSSNKVLVTISKFFSSSAWFDLEHIWYTLGFVLYAILVIAFAYFYTNISFNPIEIANNLKKSNGLIPGIRPGKPTVDYLTKQMKYMTFVGAVFLFIIAEVPTFLSLAFGLNNLSFGGTSIIIVVGVIIETMNLIKANRMSKSYTKPKQSLILSGKVNAVS